MDKIRNEIQKISPKGYLLISTSIIFAPLLAYILYVTYDFYDFLKSHPDSVLFGWLCFAIPVTAILFLTIITSVSKIKKLLGEKPSYFYFIFYYVVNIFFISDFVCNDPLKYLIC